MLKLCSRAGVALSAWAVSAACGQSFTPGNLVVFQTGDGSAALAAAATPAFLKEFTTSGTPGISVALPTTASGANHICTNHGTASSEGQLSRSVDGRYLLTVGYDAIVGTAAVNGTTSAAVARVVARIDTAGVVDTTQGLGDSFGGSSIRGVASPNGTDLWVGGNGSGAATAGVRSTTLGATSATQLSTSVTNTRWVGIAGGQLYVSAGAGAFRGVSAVGTGLPTTASQTITLLNGFDPGTTSPESPYGFYMPAADTLYVCDDRTNGNGGIQKWTLSAGTWTLAYTLVVGAGTGSGARGLTGSVDRAGQVTVYATTSETSANRLVSIVDTGAASAFALVTTAPVNTAFRGVDVAPAAAVPPPCYANCDQSTTPPILNVLDFSCFLNRFAGADSYANCDQSTTAPVLNVLDFSCFLNRFAAGCT